MSGNHITDQQIELYMVHRKTNTQQVAAARTGISERSGRRIENNQLNPKKPQRSWRTRQDPLEPVWDRIVLPMLHGELMPTPVGIFDHLLAYHSDVFSSQYRRTLERRIRQWRFLHGNDQEVMFLQEHPLGELGIVDFTHANFDVTIQGELLRHKFFHYRLVSSGWAYTQVTYGGESFAAFSDGLQNAFYASGGVPSEVRTDSLSAAYKNHTTDEDFTARYQEVIRHYGFKASRNNRGIAHENGAIESPNRHLKNQVTQALNLRGSIDFASRDEYNDFVQSIVERRNRRVSDAFTKEQTYLQSLPVVRSVNYSELTVSVSRSSTVTIKRVVYTVPSRLIGSQLQTRLYDARIDFYLGGQLTLSKERMHALAGQRSRQVDYKDVIESLVKKPRAFRSSQIRDQLFPNDDYRHIWQLVDARKEADEACFYFVRLLHLAKKSGREEDLGRFVLQCAQASGLPSLFDCEDRYLTKSPATTTLTVEQHALSSYQQLLEVRS